MHFPPTSIEVGFVFGLIGKMRFFLVIISENVGKILVIRDNLRTKTNTQKKDVEEEKEEIHVNINI